MKKPSVLLCYDQTGWGGNVRAKYIKKHLSDEFDFLLMDDKRFRTFERTTNPNCFMLKDMMDFRVKSQDKEVFDLDEFKDFFRSRKSKASIDLIYFMFHTMLVKKNCKRVLNSNIKVITIVTGFPTIKDCFLGDGKNLFNELAPKCKAIGANNYKSLDDLKKHYKGKTFYCPRGVDPKIFHPLSSRPKKMDEKFVVAYVGKPVPEKGLDIIREACNRTGAQLITNTRNFTNALSPEEMNLFYNKADAYIVASTIDGTPNPMQEAAACGKPIIANHIGNTPEFIKNGYNGYLLRKEHDRSVNKYTYWLKHLMLNREKCFEMGMNARKTILESWTWEKVTENERRIFREIINGK